MLYYGLSVQNENTFFISGDYGLVKKSNDGGSSFTNQNENESQTISDIQFLNEQIGYGLKGEPFWDFENELFKTTDGGITWILVTDDFVDSFYFVNENLGFISSKQSGLLKTTDGGLSNSFIGFQNNQESDIFSLNGNDIWNIGNNYALCDCSTSCVSKRNTEINLSITNCYDIDISQISFNAIHFANEASGFIVGNNGAIYKNSTGTMEETTFTVNKVDKKNSVIVSPNPSSDQITISFLENPTKPFSIEMTDFLGKKVYSNFFGIENVATINILPFSKGIYFLTVKTNEGKKETIKVIKK